VIVEALFALIYVIAVVVSLSSRASLGRFLDENRVIGDSRAMERFKAMARTQMYLALAMMALLTVGLVVGLVLVVRYGAVGLLPVLLANAVVFGLGLVHKKVETRVKSLPAGSDELAHEMQRVSEAWQKKPLPDF